ncbi:MAG: recombinase family protein [Bacillota bacterium]
MDQGVYQKVKPSHLKRDAYLYVRQSTLRQVFENQESTKRQYGLRERVVALGWPVERVVVIDEDLGHSGASASGREGFQRLVAEVGMGRVGIVLGLEVSRLARSSSDWYRLLEICALTDTLILDEDGVYDPGHFNDRLLLGLKGTMSEAELHVLRMRLQGGILSKARRGELKSRLPTGFVYGPDSQVVLDPDLAVQRAVRLLFDTFRRTGSAGQVVRVFREQGLRFPWRVAVGPRRGELVWPRLERHRVLRVLGNPRYAGALFFGRTQTRRTPGGRYICKLKPPEKWLALVRDAHPGYISWEEYQDNLRRLRENAVAYGADRRASPPREGPALLQGLVICGVCGKRMTVRYHVRNGRVVPSYVCQREGIEQAASPCQRIPGAGVDRAIGEMLVEAVTPLALEVALAISEELNQRAEEADRLRLGQVERARYEAELARRRYMQVDPDNRLVADVLEADWNQKLRALAEAQEEYERQRRADRVLVDEEERGRILALATDFPRLWRDPRTSDRDRKRMVRLIIEDVTLLKKENITAHVRFKGGASRTLTLPLPPSAWQLYQTDPAVVAEIDRLLDDYTDGEAALILNERGLRSGHGNRFDRLMVRKVRLAYGLKDTYSRLRDRGLLTLKEMAAALGVSSSTVKAWRRHGLLRAHAYNDKDQYLYEPPGEDAPVKGKWKLRRRKSTPATREEGAV